MQSLLKALVMVLLLGMTFSAYVSAQVPHLNPGDETPLFMLSPTVGLPGETVYLRLSLSPGFPLFSDCLITLNYNPELGSVPINPSTNDIDTELPSDRILNDGLFQVDISRAGFINIVFMTPRGDKGVDGGPIIGIPFKISTQLAGTDFPQSPGNYPIDVKAEISNRFDGSNDGSEDGFTPARGKFGTLTILDPTRVGDVNNDARVDILDVSVLLRAYLELETLRVEEARYGDTRPKPGTGGRIYGDGQIGADDLNWLLRRVIGLEEAP